MLQPTTVPEMLRRAAGAHPGRPALIFGDTVRTYAELDALSDAFAAALAARGVGPGDRVALLMHNGVEIVEAIFGALKAGAVAVPINFRLVADEVAYILEDSGATIAVAGEGIAGFADFEPYAEVLGSAPARAASQPTRIGDDLAFLMYTSGTTGRPKGAMLSHANLVSSTLAWIDEIGAGSEDVWMSGQPLFHIGGLNGLLPFIRLGATVILNPTSSFDPEAAVARLRDHAVTRCVFVPTQWHQICSTPGAAELGAGSLRSAIWGASAAPRATLELMVATLPEVEIVNAYGQTEMSGTTTMSKGDPLGHFGSVGRPLGPVEARIVDDEGGPVARGEVGELVYRGPMVMQGYHGRPEATAEAFEGGWFHSGDLLREDEDGFLFVVVRKPGATVDADDLLAHCRGRLAGYKKPARIFFVDDLPRNAAGKVLKTELRDRYSGFC